MARPSISEVIANAATSFPDNSAGAITPQVLRTWISYMLSAFYPAYAYLARTTAWTQTLNIAPAPVAFDTSFVSPIVDYAVTPVTGTIVRTERGVTEFDITLDVQGSNNQTVTFTLYKDGAPSSWRQSITLTGSANPQSISFNAIQEGVATATYQLFASSESNGQSIEFSNAAFVASSRPVYQYN